MRPAWEWTGAARVGGFALLVASAGCAPSKQPLVGYTPGAGELSPAAPGVDGGPAPVPNGLAVLGDFRSQMVRVTNARIDSRGHAGGRWTADVYADGPASAEILREEGGASVPPGSKFVEEHFERGDGGEGPTFLMEKRPPGFDPKNGDWRYAAVSSKGELVKDGAIESCAACHGDAPGDHVFRVGGVHGVDGGAP